MEDRLTPGLYLEMTDLDADAYTAERVPQVLKLPHVERATWWDNVHRDRKDLPRELPEFGRLGMYEVGDDFVVPAPGDRIAAHHFRRYPRPAQGRLTGRPTIGLSLVLISPRTEEQAQALRDWADFEHISHIAEAAVPGYSMITPYENITGTDPRFMHLYEIDDDDPERVFTSMTPRVIDRFGGPRTPEWRAWASHPALRIMYVNTFRLAGSALA